MTKFCSAIYEILALWQNRTHEQDVGHCDLTSTDFFHFNNSENQGPINAPYKISAKYTVPYGPGDNVCFIGLAIFSNSGHFFFLTRLNFIILKPCSLVMLHVKLENLRCSGFRE